jgi:phospholipase C
VVVLMQENRSLDHYFGAMPQSGDGYEPTGIALASTPTPGS